MRRMNSQKITLAIIAMLSASLALAEDFKTVNGKEYKNAEVSRVEPDGIVLKTKSGISKIYFTELPKENGARLREGHCAVDPKKIPYGSKVVFADAECVAVDSGPGVVKRKAARSCGRNVAERNAIVIDRFFNTKQKALAWARAHPRFMRVQILTPGTSQSTELAAAENPTPPPTNITGNVTTSR
jgi:3D (Asp-Asp-Asp) domain-containing protein